MMDFFIASSHKNATLPAPKFERFGFNDLPMELLLKIMKLVTMSDRIAAGETCRRWFEAAHYYTPFNEKLLFRFSNVNFSDCEPPIRNFLDGFRIFPRIEITSVTFYGNSDFWPDFGEFILELTIKNCLIRDTELSWVLQHVPNVRKLKIESCDELFRTWHFDKRFRCCESNFVLEHLQDVSLANNDFIDEMHFNWIMTISPNVAHLDISNCFKMVTAQRRVAMVDHIMRFINKKRFQLLTLKFNGTLSIDDICLSTLAILEGLCLESVSLTFCDKIPPAIIDLLRRQPELKITQALQFKVNKTKKTIRTPGFISFLTSQPELVHLDLSGSLGVTDEVMELITSCLPNLKTLKLRRCILITDEGIMDIVKLEHLEVLDLSNCERISDRAMFNGVIGRKMKKLKELYLCDLPSLSDYSLIQVTLNFELIQILDLSSTPNAATDATLQYINFYLIHLRQLILFCCSKVTDAGLTGLDLPYNPLEIWDISESFSIDRLFKLRTLNLTGCYRITDVSLQKALSLSELKELHLARCSLITELGVAELVKRSKSIEYLDLSECPNINDKCIELITANLKRLKTLKVMKCPLLTDDSLYSLSRNCQYLKFHCSTFQ
ncbi:dynein regulatory complex subunit 6-like isoform X2 [Toxorhynchites rutilus septentrionalis]|uniref:dynein regulatory complex subunit 6-like isoform X2 n=1 Tax=Toxorhynchites rutilus septentrionalis TaxID=329112 RepID=UPI0024787CE7|nr:dynein regulatory complex subunit 6-like isoform X2 [Toxorhynchites rutilus septentrionalis]